MVSASRMYRIFVFEGVGIVLRVPHDVDLLASCGHGAEYPRLGGACDDAQLGNGLDVLPLGGGVTGMGDVENVIVAAEEHGAVVVQLMLVHAEELFL